MSHRFILVLRRVGLFPLREEVFTFNLCFLSFIFLSAFHAEQYQNRKLAFSSAHFYISLLGLWLESQFQG